MDGARPRERYNALFFLMFPRLAQSLLDSPYGMC